MEPTIKLGTRCGCRDGSRCPGWQHMEIRCDADAVRMVTVREQASACRLPGVNDNLGSYEVPMCPACADFAERDK